MCVFRMPVAEEVKSSWADEVEEEGVLPSTTETIQNGFKIITEYKLNTENKKVSKQHLILTRYLYN